MAYLVGGMVEQYGDLSSKGTPSEVDQWGERTDARAFFGQSRYPAGAWVGDQEGGPFSTTDDVRSAWVHLTDQPAPPALKIVGGRQRYAGRRDDYTVDDHRWGNISPVNAEVDVYSTLAWNGGSWAFSTVRLFVADVGNPTPGYSLHGVKTMARDPESTQPFVTTSEWNNDSPGDTEQFLGTGMSWTERYGWGQSWLSIFLTPVE